MVLKQRVIVNNEFFDDRIVDNNLAISSFITNLNADQRLLEINSIFKSKSPNHEVTKYDMQSESLW